MTKDQGFFGHESKVACSCQILLSVGLLVDMAVARKPVPKWLALVSGNVDQNLRFAPSV